MYIYIYIYTHNASLYVAMDQNPDTSNNWHF